MKKIILLFTMLLVAILADAQCVPGTLSVPGAKAYILPDSATGMKHACAGLPYDETFYLKIFKDTILSTPLGNITGKTDSFIINVDATTLGLPSYLSITTSPASRPANSKHNFPHLLIKGDSLACIRVTGTPVAGTTPSTTPLNIPFVGFLKLSLGGFPIGDTSLAVTYTSYKFIIDAPGTGACAVAISNVNKNIANVNVVPNPAQNNITINAIAQKNESVAIQIVNAMGQITHTKQIDLRQGANYIPFDVQALPVGIYMYQITNAQHQVISGKFSKH